MLIRVFLSCTLQYHNEDQRKYRAHTSIESVTLSSALQIPAHFSYDENFRIAAFYMTRGRASSESRSSCMIVPLLGVIFSLILHPLCNTILPTAQLQLTYRP